MLVPDLKTIRLVSFADRKRGILPSGGGVYFIFHKGLLVYVGETGQIQTRCGTMGHEVYRRVRNRDSIQIGFISLPDIGRRRDLERLAIENHRPVFNYKFNALNSVPQSRQRESEERFIQDIADELERSYSHVRGLLKGVEPKRRIRQMPVYSTAQVNKLRGRNTKPGPNGKKAKSNNRKNGKGR